MCTVASRDTRLLSVNGVRSRLLLVRSYTKHSPRTLEIKAFLRVQRIFNAVGALNIRTLFARTRMCTLRISRNHRRENESHRNQISASSSERSRKRGRKREREIFLCENVKIKILKPDHAPLLVFLSAPPGVLSRCLFSGISIFDRIHKPPCGGLFSVNLAHTVNAR